ncbi:hypothetical protein Bbelb_186980 [Branchiostoma belcheri]|nr:hypothetical protein Bbelb_186980 [Branchiostoma belcheri]
MEGYNAKYCSYSFMEEQSQYIVDFQLVQVSETTSSQAMEKMGFLRSLEFLQNEGMNIECIATDRHEDADVAAEREEYREEWARFDEDMAYLAHLERIMDAEDSSEDEVEARRLSACPGHEPVKDGDVDSGYESRDEWDTPEEDVWERRTRLTILRAAISKIHRLQYTLKTPTLHKDYQVKIFTFSDDMEEALSEVSALIEDATVASLVAEGKVAANKIKAGDLGYFKLDIKERRSAIGDVEPGDSYFIIIPIRRQDGKPYPPKTLYNIVAAIMRHFRKESRFEKLKFNWEQPAQKDQQIADIERRLASPMLDTWRADKDPDALKARAKSKSLEKRRPPKTCNNTVGKQHMSMSDMDMTELFRKVLLGGFLHTSEEKLKENKDLEGPKEFFIHVRDKILQLPAHHKNEDLESDAHCSREDGYWTCPTPRRPPFNSIEKPGKTLKQHRAFARHNVERAGLQVPPPVRERPPVAGGDCPTSPTATTEQDLMDISDIIGNLSLETEAAMEREEEPGTPASGDEEPTPPRRGRRNAAQGRRGRRRHTPALSTEEQRERIQRLRERSTERLQNLVHAMTLEELQALVLKVVDKQPAVLLDILDVDVKRGHILLVKILMTNNTSPPHCSPWSGAARPCRPPSQALRTTGQAASQALASTQTPCRQQIPSQDQGCVQAPANHCTEGVFVSKYIGQTTEVTRNKIDKSRGGVMAIDAGYHLAQAETTS